VERKIYLSWLFFFFFAVLGIELRPMCLGRCCITWAMSPSPFAFNLLFTYKVSNFGPGQLQVTIFLPLPPK
jgi:hypothetical protein